MTFASFVLFLQTDQPCVRFFDGLILVRQERLESRLNDGVNCGFVSLFDVAFATLCFYHYRGYIDGFIEFRRVAPAKYGAKMLQWFHVRLILHGLPPQFP